MNSWCVQISGIENFFEGWECTVVFLFQVSNIDPFWNNLSFDGLNVQTVKYGDSFDSNDSLWLKFFFDFIFLHFIQFFAFDDKLWWIESSMWWNFYR